MTTTWLAFVDGAEAIRAVFKEAEPALTDVRLHEMVFHHDGPTVMLRFDLSGFPADPPEKWHLAGHNTVQLKLALDVIFRATLEGWTRNNIGHLTIRRDQAKGFAVEFRSEGSKLTVACGSVRVDHISAYNDATKVR